MNEYEADVPDENSSRNNDRPASGSESDRTAATLERVAEYVLQSIAKPDGLEAALGAINGRLIELAMRLTERFDGILAVDGDELMTSERCYPAVDVYLRLLKQIDRYSQLEIKLRGIDPKKQTEANGGTSSGGGSPRRDSPEVDRE